MASLCIASFRRFPIWLAAVALSLLASCGGGDLTVLNPNFTTTSPTASGTASNANVSFADNVFGATLSGSQQTPPVTTNATGTGVALVDPSTRQLKASITTAGITGTTANIQQAAPGSAGPIIFSMTQTGPGSGVWILDIVLNDAQLSALRSGTYYFNVRSAAFPNGEIRGQIQAGVPGTTVTSTGAATGTGTSSTTGTGTGTTTGTAGSFVTGPSSTTGIGTTSTGVGTTGTGTGTGTTTGVGTGIGTTGTTTTGTTTTGTTVPATTATATRTTFVNLLTGAQQVPPTTSNALAVGVTIIDGASGILTATITSIGILGTSAHINQAAAGVSGPIFLTLNEVATGSGIWATQATLNQSQIAALNAGNYYFDIRSAAFPNGELRGQIGSVTVTATTSPAFTTVNGTTGNTGIGTTGTTGATGIGTTGTTGSTGIGVTGTTGSTGIGTTGTTGTTGIGTTGISTTPIGTTATGSGVNGFVLITF